MCRTASLHYKYTVSLSGEEVGLLNIVQSTALVTASGLKNNDNEDIADRSTGVKRWIVVSPEAKSVLSNDDNAGTSSEDNGKKSKRSKASAVRARDKEDKSTIRVDLAASHSSQLTDVIDGESSGEDCGAKMDNIVFNKLLFYVNYRRDRPSLKPFRRVILDFFSPTEISAAKAIFYRNFNDLSSVQASVLSDVDRLYATFITLNSTTWSDCFTI